MTQTEWLSEDERELLEEAKFAGGYTLEAKDVLLLVERLAAERQKVDELEVWKTYATASLKSWKKVHMFVQEHTHNGDLGQFVQDVVLERLKELEEHGY